MPRLERALRGALTPLPAGVIHAQRLPLQLPLFDFLVLCCSCSRMQTGNGKWTKHIVRAADYPNTEFSHGICAPCLKRLYPEVSQRDSTQGKPSHQ
jgi:hypothetical protein